MSYIVEENTKEKFLENLSSTKRSVTDTALNQFNFFTTDAYQKKSETVLSDLKESYQGKFALGVSFVKVSNLVPKPAIGITSVSITTNVFKHIIKMNILI